MAAAISRRSVLAVLGVGLGTVLAACDSSETPPDAQTATPGPNGVDGTDGPTGSEPTPSRAADSGVLLLALARAQHLAATCRTITGADGWHRTVHQQLQASFDEQVRVLADVLRAGGVPVPDLSPTAETGTDSATTTGSPPDTGTATGSPSETGSPSDSGDGVDSTGDGVSATGAPGDAAETTADPGALAAARLGDLGRDCLQDVTAEVLTALSEVSAANLPMLLAVAGQRGATAQLLGADPAWEPPAGPTGAAAAGLLDAYRPAVYGFEVLAARSRGDERTAYEQVLSPLRQATRQITQLAGEAAPPAPLGYGLPESLESEASRARLAGSLTAALPATIMGPTKGFVDDPASVAGTVQLLADAVRVGQPWNPVTGFPGMQVPGA